MRIPANDEAPLSYEERRARVNDARKLLADTEDFNNEKNTFHEMFKQVAETNETLSRSLAIEFKLSAKEESNFTDGTKAPKPSVMREMVRSVRVYAECIIANPDSTPYELPARYLDAVEGRVAPNLQRRGEERPSHRPAQQARQCGQSCAR